MKLLLDTHAFLWSYSLPSRLPPVARKAIESTLNEVIVSALSFWEISIKIKIGKLEPIGSHPGSLTDIADSLGFTTIPILPSEAASYNELTEATHSDPFDRMLIWQAIQREMILVSGDAEFKRFTKYGLELLWN